MGFGDINPVAALTPEIPEGVGASLHKQMNNSLGVLAKSLGAAIYVAEGVALDAVAVTLPQKADRILGVLTFSAASLDFDAGTTTTFALNADEVTVDYGAQHGAVHNAAVLYVPKAVQ